ncbi:MAG: imidazolonepropionase [Bdellovibrionota bacterium]
MSRILYKNLKGAFTGLGFEKKEGRKVSAEDAGFVKGPLHILVDDVSKKILSVSNEDSKADKVVDCTGLVATAGFVDSHTHTLFGGARWNEFFLRWSGADYAEINAAGGGIRKTFSDTRAASDSELKKKFHVDLEAMRSDGVRLLEVKSGYGESIEEEFRILKLIQELKKESAIEIELCSTFLGLHAIPKTTDEKTWTLLAIAALEKIKNENLADFVDSFPEKGFFSLDSAKNFSKAAIALGFKVKFHADEMTHMGASELGAELGAVSVDHLQKISDRALELLSKSSTVATLLPATSFYLGIDYAPARKIVDSGARVALASDYNPGTAPNASLLFTAMLAASQMKLSPAEILCGITYNAAAALAKSKEYGLIKEGYSSKILLWDLSTEDHLEEILLSGTRPIALSTQA